MESNVANMNADIAMVPKSARVRRADLLEPDLSYKIVGALFRVFNELAPGLYERTYQRATAASLIENGVAFKEQVPIPLRFSEKIIGKYFADFLVEDRVVLELKTGSQVNRKHALQLLAYLKATDLKLGILTYFGRDGVFFKRIVNLPRDS